MTQAFFKLMVYFDMAACSSCGLKTIDIILYTDLNGMLGVPGYFDDSLCSRQRVRTLERDLRKALKGLPFDGVRPSADCLRLVRTDGHPL